MGKIKVTQIRSMIGRPQRQKDTLKALGLRKTNASVEVESSPSVLGMIDKVKHLVNVEQL